MKKLILLLTSTFILGSPVVAFLNYQKAFEKSQQKPLNVLGASTATQDIQFMVNVPAVFKKDLTAPNVIYSLKPGSGISISAGQTPTVTNTGVTSLQSKTGALTLEAGSGITIDGLKISNSGITSLSAGTGISVSGSTITNTGITSLTAGEGISIDGNKITNTRSAPDYTQSGWTDNGTTITLTTPTDAVVMGTVTFGNVTLANTKNILPDTDLGSDLGSSGLRFDNLYVANIISNASQTFSGESVFSYAPTDSTFTQASVIINPTTSVANGQLLGLAVNSYEKALIDKDGDIILGYSGLASAPVTDSPLTVYGHSATSVAHIDTSGNLTMGNTITPSGTLTIAGAVNTSGLNSSSGILYAGSQVGIGTTNPSEILTINGNFDSTSVYTQSVVNSAATTTGLVFGSSADTTSFNSAGTTNLYLSADNKVGIGTTSPGSYQLNVSGTATVSGAATLGSTLNVTGTATTAALTATSATIGGGLTVQGSTASFTGNLGIGTTAPTSQLDIAATNGTDAMRLTNSGNKVMGVQTTNGGMVIDVSSADTGNKLTNGTFETNVNSWNTTQQYSLDDEFSDTAPATLATTAPITIASGGVSNPTPTLGSEIHTSANAVSDPNGNEANATTGWSAPNSPTFQVLNDTPSAGSYYYDVTNATGNTASRIEYSQPSTAGTWYQVSFAGKYSVGAALHSYGSIVFPMSRNMTNSWTSYTDIVRANTTTVVHRLYVQALDRKAQLDNYSVKSLNLASTFSTVNTNVANDISVQADATLTENTQAGVVMNLDSASNPQNFIIAYHDGTYIRLEKVVAGTYTTLIEASATYVAGRTIKVTRVGNSYSLYYGLTQRGTTQTITDAGIINNTIHGVFSTYASNSFANFLVQNVVSNPVPTLGSDLIINGTFDTDTSWTKGTGWTIDTTDSNVAEKAAGTASFLTATTAPLTSNSWVSHQFDIVTISAGSFKARIGGFAVGTGRTAIGTYFMTGRTDNSNVGLYAETTGTAGTIDNIVVKPLTLSSLFSTVTVAASTDHTVQADVTMTAGTQAGVVLNMDSSTTPTKFVIGYINGTQACLDKNVSGTYSAVIACTSITYVAGQTLKVIQNGTSYSLFYNGTQVGTTQAVNDVPTSTIHGVFSTYASNSFANFSVTGGVNGTLATDGTNTRTVTDTTGLISVGSGVLNFPGGKASPAYGDPGVWYNSTSRVVGKMLVSDITHNITGSGQSLVGWDTNTSGVAGGQGLQFVGTSLYKYDNGANNQDIASITANTNYKTATTLRSTGAYHFIKGGIYTNWTLVWVDASNNTATLYPTYTGYSNVFTSDYLRIPTTTFLPTPLAYDTFTRGDGAIGTSETTGPDSQTTPALSWTGGAISTNKNVITPTAGSEMWNADAAAFTSGTYHWVAYGTNTIANVSNTLQITYADNADGAYDYLSTSGDATSNLTVGSWYQITADASVNAGSSVKIRFTDGAATNDAYSSAITSTSPSTIYLTNRAGNATVATLRANTMGAGEILTLDNLSLKPLTLSSLFSSVSTSDKDVVASADVTMTSGTQAGIVTNLDSTSSPANFLIAYHDGTNMHLEKNVGGTYTSLINTATTYSAGANMRVITYHSDANTMKVRVYYNNALVGTEQSLTTAGGDTNVMNGTKHGLFSTYSGNSFDNFTLFARGSDGEYAQITPADLTVTRDTATKFGGSAGSAKIVAGTTDGDFTQSVNVGDTSSYTLTAYVYTDGSAVTSSDLSLYYDTTTLTTTYAAVGADGWYKLTGTLTGVASSKLYGVRVKAGKTVYVDNLILTNGTTNTTMYVSNMTTGRANLNVQGLIDGTTGGVATFAKAGTVSDADFTTVANGMLAVDSANHRLYFREGGAWSYIAKTGGFQIPVDEAQGLSTGDLLIPYVESKMSDGALHGLYMKLSNVLTGGVATIPAFADHTDVTFTTVFKEIPVVNITSYKAEGRGAYVTNVTANGFSIYLDGPAYSDYPYSWKALLVPNAPSTKSSTELSRFMEQYDSNVAGVATDSAGID